MVDEEDRETHLFVEYSSLRDEELQVAREHREDIKAKGATELHIKEQENAPNKLFIYAYTQEEADNAAEYYNELKRDV